MSRCKIGAKLLHKWAQDVQNATMSTWQQIMLGPRQYDVHRAKCPKCREADIKALRLKPNEEK